MKFRYKKHRKFKDVLIYGRPKYTDKRGFFSELWDDSWNDELGVEFIKDNVSYSKAGTVRGLHFQNPNPQGKLVTVIDGKVLDFFVDLRKDSNTFGEWGSIELSGVNAMSVYVPEGFAHGFVALRNSTFQYKCTNVYDKEAEKTLSIFDPEIGIPYETIIDNDDGEGLYMSQSDLIGRRLSDFQPHELF